MIVVPIAYSVSYPVQMEILSSLVFLVHTNPANWSSLSECKALRCDRLPLDFKVLNLYMYLRVWVKEYLGRCHNLFGFNSEILNLCLMYVIGKKFWTFS